LVFLPDIRLARSGANCPAGILSRHDDPR
jgi:hypothetical protein